MGEVALPSYSWCLPEAWYMALIQMLMLVILLRIADSLTTLMKGQAAILIAAREQHSNVMSRLKLEHTEFWVSPGASKLHKSNKCKHVTDKHQIVKIVSHDLDRLLVGLLCKDCK